MSQDESTIQTPVADVPPAPVLYDAAAEQRVPLKVVQGRKFYRVTHVFSPVNREAALEYEKRRSTKFSEADASETDAQGVVQTSTSSAAAIWLWEKLIIRVEGIKAIPNWRELVKPTDKVLAVTKGLMAFSVEEDDEKSRAEGELDLEATDDGARIPGYCLVDGEYVDVVHILNFPSAAQVNSYTALMSAVTRVKGTKRGKDEIRVGSKAKQLAEFYDDLQISHEGYAGKVPFHHKSPVVIALFEGEDEIDRKN